MLNPGIESIQAQRQKLLDAFDANPDFEKGIHIAAAQLYAGKCHFIYELLQNAGDAGAEHVEFTLSNDSLELRHDGKRLFDSKDVDSITNYHASSKQGEDYETVGKFGMGFKSVFEYTQQPEIQSGNYHFRIKRMFYPDTENIRNDENLGKWTKFVFPFGSYPEISAESPEDIFKTVKRGLQDIRPNTILFLNKIVQIECLFDDGTYLKIIRDNQDHLVRITRTTSTETSCSYYLKFSKQIKKSGTEQRLGLDVAYGLLPKEDLDPTLPMSSLSCDRFSLAEVIGGAFVYFPAEKETTNLKFHINAAFATPMSRETLCETKENETLLESLAGLTVESLPYLRDNGYLTVEALSLFPLDSDSIPERYRVFGKAIVEAFKTRDLVPTKSGDFKRADSLLRSANRMSELFTDEDMSVIYPQYQSPVWSKAPAQLNSRADKFVSSLGMKSFGDNELKPLVKLPTYAAWGIADENDSARRRLKTVIARFDDKRLRDFYKRLEDYKFQGGDSLESIFMSKARTLRPANTLYFDFVGTPEGHDEEFLLNVCDGDKDVDIRDFLKAVGVREYSVANVLERDYKRITAATPANESNIELHKKFVLDLIAAVEKENAPVSKYSGFVWLCRDNKGALKFDVAENIVMDKPYEETGMRLLLKAYPARSNISSFYSENFTPEQLQSLKRIFAGFEFVRSVKETYIHEYGCVSVTNHPRYDELKPPYWSHQYSPWYRDCDIYQVEELIRLIDDNISVRLWNLLVTLKCNLIGENPFRAVYHHNGRYEKSSDSLLVCHLMVGKWIKTIDGEWKCPADVNFSTLDPMYGPRVMCDGLRAVKFGSRAQDVKLSNSEKQKAIEGFVAEIGAENQAEAKAAVKMCREAKRLGIDIQAAISRKRAAADMSVSAQFDVGRQQERATADWQQAPERTTETRVRTVRSGPSIVPDAHALLLRAYTDDDGLMRCQMCQRAMPFNKRDGNPYFECLQVFNEPDKVTVDQYLALCPECSALYDEWVRKYDPNAMSLREAISSIKNIDGRGSVIVKLPEFSSVACHSSPLKDKSLYFTSKHFTALQTVLKAEDGNVSQGDIS